MPSIRLRINGRVHDLDVPAEKPLLWILRDDLGLKGTKYGCGIAECGVCTVLIGDEAVRSCATLAADVGDAEITTIEGLGGDHPLQRAWIEDEVPQCGYCQPGQILQAAALLRGNPHPNDADIDRAMDGNLCRCGTYQRIKRAIRKTAGGGR